MLPQTAPCPRGASSGVRWVLTILPLVTNPYRASPGTALSQRESTSYEELGSVLHDRVQASDGRRSISLQPLNLVSWQGPDRTRFRSALGHRHRSPSNEKCWTDEEARSVGDSTILCLDDSRTEQFTVVWDLGQADEKDPNQIAKISRDLPPPVYTVSSRTTYSLRVSDCLRRTSSHPMRP